MSKSTTLLYRIVSMLGFAVIMSPFMPNAFAEESKLPPAPTKDVKPAPHSPVELMFEAYDTDHDNRLSENECLHATIRSFEQLDGNGNLEVSSEEFSLKWSEFPNTIDKDKNHRLSLAEALDLQRLLFRERDKDHDGALSKQEVQDGLTKNNQAK